MSETISLEVTSTGAIRALWDDMLPSLKLGEISRVRRASDVEWEELPPSARNARFPGTRGWTVRAHHNPKLAIRIETGRNAGMGSSTVDNLQCSDNESNILALFGSRAQALEAERQFFHQLLPQEGT